MSAVPGSVGSRMSHEVPNITDLSVSSVLGENMALPAWSTGGSPPSTVVESQPPVFSSTANNDIPIFEMDNIRVLDFLSSGAQAFCEKVFVKNIGICVRKMPTSSHDAAAKNERREMVHSAMLNHHPNIVSFYGVVAYDRRLAPVGILMEYMPGGSLSNYLFKRPSMEPIDRDLKTEWCKQIGLGLAYMHSRGIMHRDLNPNNILLSDRRLPTTVKICDFGLSREIDGGSMTLQTGTGAFMAPEVILNGNRTYDSSADVFSYGMTVYSIFAETLPFANEGVENWSLFAHRTRLLGERPEYSDRPEIPESAGDMGHVIKLCWNSDAELRPKMERVNDFLEQSFGLPQ